MSWQPVPTKITAAAFKDLFENRIPYIEVDHFYSQKQCETLQKHLLTLGFTPSYVKDDTEAHAHYVFDTHYFYETKTPEEYFPKAKVSIERYENLCKELEINPAKETFKYLRSQTHAKVSIAHQDGQSYTYALVRALKREVFIHADFAKFLEKYWSISSITAELAWNIYISDPGKGGECVVYNRPWELKDNVHIMPNTYYGYDPSVVEGCESVAIPITPGKLLFFNSRNFHKVNESQNLRLSFGGHIGLESNGEMLAWI